MAARAKALGDTGESSPENWNSRSGRRMSTLCSSQWRQTPSGLRRRLIGPAAYKELPGITAIWRQDCHVLPTETEPFGFRDGISHPAIEGSGIPGTNPKEQPLRRANSFWAIATRWAASR